MGKQTNRSAVGRVKEQRYGKSLELVQLLSCSEFLYLFQNELEWVLWLVIGYSRQNILRERETDENLPQIHTPGTQAAYHETFMGKR